MQRLTFYLVLGLVALAVGVLAYRSQTRAGPGGFMIATPGAPAFDAS